MDLLQRVSDLEIEIERHESQIFLRERDIDDLNKKMENIEVGPNQYVSVDVILHKDRLELDLPFVFEKDSQDRVVKVYTFKIWEDENYDFTDVPQGDESFSYRIVIVREKA